MKVQIASWVCLGVNLLSIGVYTWMTVRVARLRARDQEALEIALEKIVEDFGPALAFCALMRDTEGVPTAIRKTAASAIPTNVEIHKHVFAAGKRIVH